MSIRVNMCPVVDFDEIECELDLKITDFDFYHRADHTDGYLWIGTDEDDLIYANQTLADELDLIREQGEEWRDEEYIAHLENDIMLINKFREMGLTDGVIIYIWN